MKARKVNIHNEQRAAKRQREKERESWVITPPKYTYKHTTQYVYDKYEKRYGYDYDCKDSRTLKWMKQQFQDKMIKYLGAGEYVKKMGRMDKYKRSQRLGFKPEMNPIIRIFNKMEKMIELEIKRDVLESINNY